MTLFRAVRLAAGAALAGLLASCSLSTPLRGPGYDASRGVTGMAADDRVVVAVTNAVIDRSRREPFDRSVRSVVDTIARHPGLIGYSMSRNLLGDEVWTMTVWRTDEARAAFVASREHRDAMAAGMASLKTVRFLRFEMPAREVPQAWKRARAMMDSAGRAYSLDATNAGSASTGAGQ